MCVCRCPVVGVRDPDRRLIVSDLRVFSVQMCSDTTPKERAGTEITLVWVSLMTEVLPWVTRSKKNTEVCIFGGTPNVCPSEP